MHFDIVPHYHTTIKVNNTNKPRHEKGYYNRPHRLPSPTASGMLAAKAATTDSDQHGYPMVTKPLNLGRVTGYCMYGKLRYPTLSRVAYWNCTCEVVRGSSLLPALLAAALAGVDHHSLLVSSFGR